MQVKHSKTLQGGCTMKISSYNRYTPQQRPMFKRINLETVKKAAHETKQFAQKTGDKGTNTIAYALGALASLKPVQNLVNYLKNKNYQEHLAAFVGCTLSGFYMLDTARSKTIEKDQKTPLMINQGAVCAMSTVGAYTLNHYLNRKINHIAELFHIAKIKDENLQQKFLKFRQDPEYASVIERAAKTNPKLQATLDTLKNKFEFTNNVKVYLKEEIKKQKGDSVAQNFLKEIKKITVENGKDKADAVKALYLQRMKNSKAMRAAFNREGMNNAIKMIAGADKTKYLTRMMNGFKTAQALMVFALLYRFVSPVIATPIANNISEKLEKRKKLKKANV